MLVFAVQFSRGNGRH